MPILFEDLDSIDYVITAVTFTQKYRNIIKTAATTITIMSINIQLD